MLRSRRGGRILAAAILTLTAADAAKSARPHQSAAPRTAPAGNTALRAGIDAESGQLEVPPGNDTQEQGRPLPAVVPMEVRADGTTILDVRGRGRNYTVARLQPDGGIATGCTTHPECLDRSPAGVAQPHDRVLDAQGRVIQ